jgi:L-asparaginase
VVLASRTGAGRVVPAYGGPGGGRTLVEHGVIPAGDLSGPKARVALMLALGAGLDAAAVRDLFARLGGYR